MLSRDRQCPKQQRIVDFLIGFIAIFQQCNEESIPWDRMPCDIVPTSNLLKIDIPYLVARTPKTIFSYQHFWVVCGLVWVQKQIKNKRHVFGRDWIVCPKYESHSRLTGQHNWGTLYEHVTSMRMFTLVLIRYSNELQNYGDSGTALTQNCSHILGEVGKSERVTI